MPDDHGERTEAPSPHRRREAREEGTVAKSPDLSGAVVMLVGVLLLAAFGSHLLATMKVLVQTMLGGGETALARPQDMGRLWWAALELGAQALAPVALGVLAAALAAGLMQVGVLVTLKPLAPRLSKVSPLRGLKQLFSKRGAVRLVMSLGKVAIVLAVAWVSIHFDLPKVLALVRLETEPLLAASAWLIWSLALKIAAALLLLGLLDYAYQRWQHEQDLKMTRHEVKEEMKRMEGDPVVKQRRSKVARQLALQRLTRDVPRADVVVTNPMHYAVALRYDGRRMNAPKVIAKGADYLAIRIRQLAAVHGVPIVERPPLARALYRGVEAGQEVPPQFYAAVAEIMAYVYRLSGRKSA